MLCKSSIVYLQKQIKQNQIGGLKMLRKYFEVEENAKQFAKKTNGIAKINYVPNYNYLEKVIFVEYEERIFQK